VHDRLALAREQPGKQQTGLHLGARNREAVVDAAQGRTLDREGRPAVRALDARAHAAQRLGDPLHRPGAERLVAGQLEPSPLPRQRSREEAHQRAGVAAVDRLPGGLQPPETHAPHAQHVHVLVDDVDSQSSHGAHRRLRVAGAAEPPDHRLPFRERREENGAVRDRLVARHRDVARERARRRDEPRHPAAVPGTAGSTTAE
jgi:hypothetical protein